MKAEGSPFHFAVIAWALLMSLLLVSCGSDSGGGDSKISYSGATDPADVNAANAEELSRGAFENGEIGTALSDLSPAAVQAPLAEAGLIQPRLLSFAQALEDLIADMPLPALDAPSPAKAAQSGTFESKGSCGGTMEIKATADRSTGLYEGTINFNKYCQSGILLDGSLSMDGSYDAAGDTFFSLNFNFNLSFQANNDSFALQGDMAIDYDGSQASLIMNLLVKDSGSGKVFWIDGYAWTVTDYDSYATAEFAGRFYHPDYGYVDVDTDQAFVINQNQDSPSSGILTVTGRNNTRARLTVLSPNAYTVEVDIGDGNGYVLVVQGTSGLD